MECIQNGYKMDTQVSIDKVSIGKVSLEEGSEGNSGQAATPTTSKRFVKPTLEEVTTYCQERKNNVNPQMFIDFYTSKGWKVGREPMKDWQACVRTWEGRECGKKAEKNYPTHEDSGAEYTDLDEVVI